MGIGMRKNKHMYEQLVCTMLSVEELTLLNLKGLPMHWSLRKMMYLITAEVFCGLTYM